MGIWLQLCSYAVIIPLQILAIGVFVRGPYRRFPFVFAYLLADFLATAAEVPTEVNYFSAKTLEARAAAYPLLERVYWINEFVLQVLVFAAVISLLYSATAALRSRRIVRLGLVVGAVAFAGVSFAIHRGSGDISAHVKEAADFTAWMTPWSRDLNVCATVLDLSLWTLLIGARFKDNKLLLLSGSLGIMFAGDAISTSMRNMATNYKRLSGMGQFLWFSGDAASILSTLAFLFLIWQTFRLEARAYKTVKPPQAERLHTDS